VLGFAASAVPRYCEAFPFRLLRRQALIFFLLLRRKQYVLDRARLPTFSKLYDVFMSLEKEIEDALPQFQELLLTLKYVFFSCTYDTPR
jgi:hypothetical protein